MRIINKPDIKQTLITTGYAFAAGVLCVACCYIISFFGLLVSGSIYAGALALSVRARISKSEASWVPFVILFPIMVYGLVVLILLGCWMYVESHACYPILQNWELLVTMIGGLPGLLTLVWFNMCFGNRSPLLQYVLTYIATGLMFLLAVSLLQATTPHRGWADSHVPELMLCLVAVLWHTLTGLCVGLSITKSLRNSAEGEETVRE